jgi:hypothetical protein
LNEIIVESPDIFVTRVQPAGKEKENEEEDCAQGEPIL